MFPVDESFGKSHGVTLRRHSMPSFSSPAHGERLNALRWGHSALELYLPFRVHLLRHTAAQGAECHDKGALRQVPNQKLFWASEPWLISMNETLCAGGSLPHHH